ncbi:hypothetical protein [Neolewinella agarilytica]|uniref:Uncharacterized protein n=1 Tax=Neolewinella agarilytica TaxID=478744 RepID=A0A1H9KYX9_9BACT|nr:hypothetical protein [Neolewinella agarilytica]SER04366.1 hypothetical protein SAMN05444359_12253 [Neolewinella agarilytica]
MLPFRQEGFPRTSWHSCAIAPLVSDLQNLSSNQISDQLVTSYYRIHFDVFHWHFPQYGCLYKSKHLPLPGKQAADGYFA